MFAPRTLVICFATIFAPLVLTAAAAATADDELRQVDVTQRWAGKNPDASRRELAPESGVISDAATWEKLWKAWHGEKAVPQVDFEKELVLVGTAPGPNLIMMQPMIDRQGDVRFSVGATRMAGPGFGYNLLKIRRAGVRSVNDTKLPGDSDPNGGADRATKAEESITVTVVGTLRTGIFAIGGETTGTTITAKGITWELDFGDQAKFRRMAESLNEKQVVVRGSLERRSGVEIKQRWIVHVSDLEAAALNRPNPDEAARQ